MKRRLFLLLLAVLGLNGLRAQEAEIKGVLKDAASGEALIFTVVELEETGQKRLSDENGFFLFPKLNPGIYHLKTAAMGFDSLRKTVEVEAGQMKEVKLELEPAEKQIREVEISGEHYRKEKDIRIATSTLNPKEVRQLPAVGGESDLTQYLQVLPGVVSTGDQGGQIYIRGGAPYQNLVLLDGMVIYNPFHSIGLFSVFDTDILKSAEVYSAAFPASFGGRTSAVIDVKTQDGNLNAWKPRFSLNPMAAKASIQGPLWRSEGGGGASVVFSHRQMYLNQSSQLLYDYATQPGEDRLPFSFADTYGKISFLGSGASKASLFGFNFTDEAGLGQGNRISWDSQGAGGQFFLAPPTASMAIEGRFGLSNYSIGIEEATAAPRQSEVGSFNGGLFFRSFLPKSEFHYGLGLVGNNTSFRTHTPTGIDQQLEKFNTELYSFLTYRYAGEKWVLEPGMRLHYYASLATFSPEPRMRAKYKITDRLRVQAGAGLYSQNLLTTRSTREVVNLFAGFISSPSNTSGKSIEEPVQRANHLLAGVQYDLLPGLTLNLEAYRKGFPQLINVNPDKVFPEDPDFVEQRGEAIGFDFFATFQKGRWRGRANYGWARNTRQLEGTTYAPPFDRRHNVNALLAYQLGQRQQWELSARWNFGSGFPFTQTQAFFERLDFSAAIDQDIAGDNGELGTYFGGLEDFNDARLPPYHRLDLQARYKRVLGEWEMEAHAGVTNAYNRSNIFFFDRVAFERVDQLPILPSFGLKFNR